MPEFFDTDARVGVLTCQPLDRVLDYRAPEGGVRRGAYVLVPLGPRRVLGVVWGKGEGSFPESRLRPIAQVLDLPLMQPELRAFIDKLAHYTLTALPAVLRLHTRVPGLDQPPEMRRVYALGSAAPQRMTEARARVMALLDEMPGQVFALGELATAVGVSSGVVKGLAAQGAIVQVDAPRDLPFAPLDLARPGKPLTPAQDAAAQAICARVGAGYGTTLLRGVTGAGKTEVYLEAVRACLQAGRQALVLLPEIALTAEFLTRVEARFGARPAEWHSGVTQAARRRCWRMAAEGGAQLVVGARSALFLPFRDLGLIVVDEEHDGSYKQEEGVLYHARDMAVLRASLAGAQVVLASATPSLESWANAQAGKYARVDLTERYGPAILPRMEAVDLRQADMPSGTWISPVLAAQVRARIAAGEQSLLFLNRRGYAPVTVCRACGHQIQCADCDASMVEHRFVKQLVCHQCGVERSIPETCPSCGVADKLTAIGPGVERLAEEAAATFPEARIALLSSDLFGSARALKEQITAIARGEADVIIGTQLVAKGHNFPKLTLVGVIDADLGLQGGDLRAAERSFQLIRQVSGRAGRAEAAGLALIQTHQPEHPVIRAILAGDEEAFWRAQAAERQAAGVPPYGRMAGIIVSGSDLGQVMALAQHLARHAEPLHRIGAELFGPALAPIARIRGRHRVRLLVKAAKAAPLQAALREWIALVRPARDLRVVVDIDPQSFF